MRHAWSRTLVVALGAGLCWGGMALAKSPKVEERELAHDSCLTACSRDHKTCSDACKKHAGAGADLCTKACGDLQKECEQDCKNPGGKK
jgi:hypothetical protein